MGFLTLSWVTAATFLLVTSHVEALDCYYCKWIEATRNDSNVASLGRDSNVASLYEKYEKRVPQLLSDARRTLPEDPTCKSSKPVSTVSCRTGCSWTIFSNPAGKIYLRGCAATGAPLGKCTTEHDGVVMCHCDKSNCNGLSTTTAGGPVNAPNSSFRSLKEGKILVAAGLLAIALMGVSSADFHVTFWYF